MVNTVGSPKTNKFWNKKWIPIKNNLRLTQIQREVIVGSLLGDGTMRKGKDAEHANFKVEHGLAQKDYVLWKYSMLKDLVFTEPKISFRYKNNGEKYPKSWWFRTIRHPLLTEIYNSYYSGDGYRTGKKIIPVNFIHDLTPSALAIWIMDDGSYNKNRKGIDISTYAFPLEEIIKLQSLFRKVFKLKASFYKDRDKGYRMYFSISETKALIHIIHPYIIPSMMYKIGF
ncbi:MAG: hypothetical protein HYS86_01740 [Candidatus Chisholmbacteria bacterium]|nr:hypothetical protein [Candidatus Chisholmbacteria bacterium]MBI4058129.1 hypothetical protein [Candidatus Gottesmanbacteria bacterium]